VIYYELFSPGSQKQLRLSNFTHHRVMTDILDFATIIIASTILKFLIFSPFICVPSGTMKSDPQHHRRAPVASKLLRLLEK
jgi:hypothetical protein